MDTETATEGRRAIPADTLPARLMLARLHAGNLTVSQAAERCGLLRESWSNWERGMKPRDVLDVVERISEGLDIDRDWLLFGGQLAVPNARPPRRSPRLNARLAVASPERPMTERPMSGPPRVKTHPNGRPRNNPTHPASAGRPSQRRPEPRRSSARRMAA